MIVLKIIAALSIGLLVYTYVGYPVIMLAIRKIKGRRKKSVQPQEWPNISLIITAFNEQECIEAKIENSLGLSYPEDKLQVVVVTDGSDDKTGDIAGRYDKVDHLHLDERRGKLHAMNRATSFATGDIKIYTDANTLLNGHSLQEIVVCFQDPQVGAVSGEKRVCQLNDAETGAANESLYWKYESMLKDLDADLYSVIGAAGELFAVRSELYEAVPDDTILDDFMLTLRINMKGYRTEYAPTAYAIEAPSTDLASEYHRKTRIAAGGWQSISRLMPLLNPLVYGLLSIQYVSRRVARWVFAPLALLLLLISSTLGVVSGAIWAQWLLCLQLAFYCLAAFGWYQGAKADVLSKVAFYFTFMHVCVIVGAVSFFTGTTSVIWKKATRLNMMPDSIMD